MNQNPDGSGKTAGKMAFLEHHKGKLPRPAGASQNGGGIKGVNVAGNGKNNRDNVFFRKIVGPEEPVIQTDNLFGYVFFGIFRPYRSP
jgi:hypothetical protein